MLLTENLKIKLKMELRRFVNAACVRVKCFKEVLLENMGIPKYQISVVSQVYVANIRHFVEFLPYLHNIFNTYKTTHT